MAEVKPGKETSEWSLTRLASWAGIAMVVVGGLHDMLSQLVSFVPENKALSVALVVCGVVLKLGAVLGYQRARAEVKRGMPSLPEAEKELGK